MTFEAVLLAVLAWFLVSVVLGLFVGKWLHWAGEDEGPTA